MSNVNPPRARKAQREAAQQFIDTLQGMAFPNSRRIYLQGSRSISRCLCAKFSSARPWSAAAKTTHSMNPTRRSVYDTAGPYGDPQAELDVHAGLAKLRTGWIDARGDTAT